MASLRDSLPLPSSPAPGDGLLAARPHARDSLPPPLGPGLYSLVVKTRPALFYAPPSALERHGPSPLLVCLHAAGGSGAQALGGVRAHADEEGCFVLAPSSRGEQWDLDGELADDVEALDDALAQVFARASIDERHVEIGGYGDGADAASALARRNVRLFARAVALPDTCMRARAG